MQLNSVDNVCELGLNFFRDNVVHYEGIQDHLKNILKEMIEKGHRGEAIDIMEIHNASRMLSDLGSDSLYQEIFGDIVEKTYRMTAYPRGFCIIITNNKFTNGERREGTNEETNLLSSLFNEMDFKVINYRDLTHNQMKSELEAVASHEDLKKHDALIVIISSHGNSQGVLGSDGAFCHL